MIDDMTSERIHDTTAMGIIPPNPLREKAVGDLRLGKPEARQSFLAWLDNREKAVSTANTSVASLGLIIDIGAVYEDAERHENAADAYRAAREAAWHEHMDGIIRSLDEKLDHMYAFGLADSTCQG